MFTGIVETTGKIIEVQKSGTNISFRIQSPISTELKVDQSVSHNGVCLTVEAIADQTHTVTAIEETLNKTTLADWAPNKIVNLERCMVMNGRLDGHIVQGHIDCTAICNSIEAKNGSWLYEFRYPEHFAPLLVEKGSVAVEGVSLTAFNITPTTFNVAIIPYTFEHTAIGSIRPESRVNIEFDIIGKYVLRSRLLEQRNFTQ